MTAKQLEGHTQVDTIVSECLGVLLVHERMCESFSRRKRSIPSSGRVGLPFGGTICLARSRTSSCGTIPPTKRNGGSTATFTASTSHPSPPSLSRRTFPARRRRFPGQCLLSVSSDYVIDFASITQAELREFTVPVEWSFANAAIVHGLGGWFDLHFNSQSSARTTRTLPWAKPPPPTTVHRRTACRSKQRSTRSSPPLLSPLPPPNIVSVQHPSMDAVLTNIPTISTTSPTATL